MYVLAVVYAGCLHVLGCIAAACDAFRVFASMSPDRTPLGRKDGPRICDVWAQHAPKPNHWQLAQRTAHAPCVIVASFMSRCADWRAFTGWCTQLLNDAIARNRCGAFESWWEVEPARRSRGAARPSLVGFLCLGST